MTNAVIRLPLIQAVESSICPAGFQEIELSHTACAHQQSFQVRCFVQSSTAHLRAQPWVYEKGKKVT